jgi:predicted nucleic acid-binding protein
MPDRVIVDASAMVDLLVGSPVSVAVHERLRARELHAPAHFDAEVLSAASSAPDISRIGKPRRASIDSLPRPSSDTGS